MRDNPVAVKTRTMALEGPAVLKPRQVRDLLDASDCRTRLGKRDSALAAVLANGLRIGEAVHLVRDNIDLAPNGVVRLTVKTSKTRAGTPARWRTVTMFPQSARRICAYIWDADPRWWVFSGRHGEPLGTRQARRIIKGLLNSVGAGQYRVHDLRHTYASIVVRETRSIFVAQKLLGHSDPRITSRAYAQWDTTDSDNAALAVAGALTRRDRGR